MNAQADSRPSYRKVNYVLRPAKNVERKMMCEMFARLGTFGPMPAYRYIGFGSVYFADFSLMHRELGISSMISIEGNVEDEARVIFNRPYACVDVLMGVSSERLQDIDFDRSSIVWLDYDTELSRIALADIDIICVEIARRKLSGSFLAVTVDVGVERLSNPKSVREEERETWPRKPLEQLARIVGDRHVDPTWTSRDLRGDRLPGTYRTMLESAVRNALNSQNGVADDADKIEYRQVINFLYADNAKMMTVGWVLYRRSDAEIFDRCGFANFDFFRDGSDAYQIASPNLTYREIRALDQQLPGAAEDASQVPIPAEDREGYARLYRYFPAFVEAEL